MKPDIPLSVNQQTFQVSSVEGERKRGPGKRGSLKSCSWLSRQVDTLQQQDVSRQGTRLVPKVGLGSHFGDYGCHDELQQINRFVRLEYLVVFYSSKYTL